ncbi:MAG: hypothetical protein ACE5JG_00425 [Planctomycetota bacterium]
MAYRSRRSGGRFQPASQGGVPQIVVGIGVVALIALIVVVASTGSTKPPPAPAAVPAPAPEPKPVPKATPERRTPPRVPARFMARVEREWPELERKNGLAKAHFKAARDAKKSGDRARLQQEVLAGKKIYDELLEAWSGIVYSVQDEPDAVIEACERWLRPKAKIAKLWASEFKALKDLSTR